MPAPNSKDRRYSIGAELDIGAAYGNARITFIAYGCDMDDAQSDADSIIADYFPEANVVDIMLDERED